MGFGAGLHSSLARNLDLMTSGRWNTDSPWHKMSLLRVTPAEKRDGIQGEGMLSGVNFRSTGKMVTTKKMELGGSG